MAGDAYGFSASNGLMLGSPMVTRTVVQSTLVGFLYGHCLDGAQVGTIIAMATSAVKAQGNCGQLEKLPAGTVRRLVTRLFDGYSELKRWVERARQISRGAGFCAVDGSRPGQSAVNVDYSGLRPRTFRICRIPTPGRR